MRASEQRGYVSGLSHQGDRVRPGAEPANDRLRSALLTFGVGQHPGRTTGRRHRGPSWIRPNGSGAGAGRRNTAALDIARVASCFHVLRADVEAADRAHEGRQGDDHRGRRPSAEALRDVHVQERNQHDDVRDPDRCRERQSHVARLLEEADESTHANEDDRDSDGARSNESGAILPFDGWQAHEASWIREVGPDEKHRKVPGGDTVEPPSAVLLASPCHWPQGYAAL